MRKLGDPCADGVRQWGQLMAGSVVVPVSPICVRRMKSFKHPCSDPLVGKIDRLVFGKCWLDKCVDRNRTACWW